MSSSISYMDGLSVQKDAQDPETFALLKLSFSRDTYEAIFKGMRLPLQAVELTGVVGPVFWHRYVMLDGNDPHLQMILSKHDVRKFGLTRGFQMILSYSFRRRETTGFVKGTKSSAVSECIDDLLHCSSEIFHPLLLPNIMMSHLVSDKNEQKQRDARSWIRHLESKIISPLRDDLRHLSGDIDHSTFDLRLISSELAECHAQVLWTPPSAYLKIVEGVEDAMQCFWQNLLHEEKTNQMERLHESLASRLKCQKVRLDSLESYASNDAKLNLKIAGDQRQLAHASKDDSQAMKALSLLGATFLPGTFLASIFSMTFFDFQSDLSLSPKIWIYFAFTIPLTIFVLLGWYKWDKKRKADQDDAGSKLANSNSETELAILSELSRR
ncbi:hypothetical protein LZ31DRAFT_566719 [Colletotrichum somersetense]|nr:hypothetical protein LZ31DRAFT_566719 [Colletotrichum somersetense]